MSYKPYKTDIQKMFVDLKAKVKETEDRAALGEDSVETDAEVEEKQKSKKFFESVTSCQDKGLVTDIETDNEYIPGKDSDSDGSGYEELEIEIQVSNENQDKVKLQLKFIVYES